MTNQIAVRVLRTVAVSDDGIRTRDIIKGTDDFVPASTFDGLAKEGYVEPIPTPEPGEAPPALEEMKAAELKAFAEERGIDVSKAKNKAEAVAMIREAMGEAH